MTFVDRIERPEDFRHWFGDMEAQYVYTSGVAGDKFFNELKNGKILGTHCKKCGKVYVPPRMYCEECFVELDDWVTVDNTGVVDTFTVVHVDRDENPLDEPEVWGVIHMEGTDGGFVHKLNVSPDDIRIGMPVKAVFKSKKDREGRITDIKYFE
ncbi:MAG: Zn-ribbon domain-containing OB-fold protein [Candidatus Methanofastidiosia archaeon]|jgi:uncharacterized OB-fold protein